MRSQKPIQLLMKVLTLEKTVDTLQRRSDLCIPEMKLRSPVPNFLIHVSVRDLHISTHDRSNYFAVDHGNILIAHRYINVGIENKAAQFHFCEYLF
jgi:hypothetical protein